VNKKQSLCTKLISLWEDRSKFKMHAIMSKNSEWFLIERHMMEKYTELFKIRDKRVSDD